MPAARKVRVVKENMAWWKANSKNVNDPVLQTDFAELNNVLNRIKSRIRRSASSGLTQNQNELLQKLYRYRNRILLDISAKRSKLENDRPKVF